MKLNIRTLEENDRRKIISLSTDKGELIISIRQTPTKMNVDYLIIDGKKINRWPEGVVTIIERVLGYKTSMKRQDFISKLFFGTDF